MSTLTGDWAEDFPHENGRYQCRCIECDDTFYGHKRRVICKACATKETPPDPSAETAAAKELREFASAMRCGQVLVDHRIASGDLDSSKVCREKLAVAERRVEILNKENQGLLQRTKDAESAVAKAQQRIEGYQGSRDYAIDLLAGALGIEADKVRAIEYYARLAAEALAKAREGALEEAAKAINKKVRDVCSDPEICYTESDTGAAIIAKGWQEYVEALDDAEAIVRSLRSRTPQEPK